MTAAAPTGPAGRAAEWIGYQLAVHPRLRQATMIWLCGHLLAVWAVITAPRAAAAPAIALLGFTGLTDSRGVPVSYYYLSTVSTAEKIREGGPGLSINPNSWVEWLSESLTTGLTYSTVAAWLQMQAALYVTMVALALWALNFVLSLQWLTFLASWFRPLFDALQLLVVDLYLFPICLAIGMAVGAFHVVFNNRMGRGWRVILSTVVIGILGFVVTRDPVSDLGSENGLLAQARRVGLDVSSAAIGNTAVAPAGTDPIQTLSASLVDAMIRAPLQLFNFGTPIDGIGGCAAAWDNAISRVDRSADGPVRAMETCGATDQLAYAQQLDGSSLGVGLFFLLFGAAFTLFIVYVAYSYFMVAGAAFVNAIWLLFAAPLAMIDGAPRQRAWRRFTEFFRHAVLVAVYVLYLSFAAVIVKQISAPGGYADQIGMTSPFPKLILTALVSVAAIGVFAWLKKQLGDQVRQSLVAKVRNTAAAGRAGMERGQRHNARAGATLAAAKTAAAPPSDGEAAGEEALTGPPSPGRSGTNAARSAGRGARVYRAAKAGVATAASPAAVAATASAGVGANAAAGAANRARPGASTPPAAARGPMTPVSPATPGRPSAAAGIARGVGLAASAVVPPSVARAAGYAAGLAGGSAAVTATRDRLRNGKPPAAGPADESDVQDTLSIHTPAPTQTPQPSQSSYPPPEPHPPGGDTAEPGSDPTPGRSG